MRLKKLIQLKNRTDGVSIIEFAIAAPVLIVVFFYGGFEVWSMVSASMRVNKAASHVASVAARADANLDEGAVTSLLNSAERISVPTPLLANGRVVLSAVAIQMGSPRVMWQRCKGTRTDYASTIGTVGQPAAMASNNLPVPPVDITALVAETYYDYTFTFFELHGPTMTLKHKSVSLGREDIPATVKADMTIPSNC
jgi:TadE-like protein